MDKFIKDVMQQLDISEEKAKATTTNLLNLLAEQLDENTATRLIRSLPQAKNYLHSSPPGAVKALLSGVLGKTKLSLGDKFDNTFSLLSNLQTSGLNTDQARLFLGLFTNFIKEQAGRRLFNKVFAGLPQLRALAA